MNFEAAAEVDPSTPARRTITPGDGLLNPIALAALGALILNDQVLKAAWPGPVTGKLSDVAGLIVAPLAIQAAVEVGLAALGRWEDPSRRVSWAGIAIVGAGPQRVDDGRRVRLVPTAGTPRTTR